MRRRHRIAGAGVAAVFALALAAHVAGLYWNTTGSIPTGLYRVSSEPVTVGAYVLVCPVPDEVANEARARGYIGAGWCPGRYGYLMKRTLAAKGDRIDLRDEGVRVNGRLLPASARVAFDGAGRPMPRPPVTSATLASDEVLLMADGNPRSFDGRYFGPVRLAQIKTVLQPVITWN
jgi:conjugative transfer signal peptidase TraF